MNQAKLVRALQFLRVLDADANISLTNIALVAALVRTLMLPQLTVHDLGVFLGTVVAYQVRKFAQPAGTPDNADDLKTAVAELQTKVTSLQLSNGLSQGRRS